MTAQTIATAKIRLRPDLSGFKEDTDAQVKQATAGGGTVRITADTDEAKRKADELRLRLDEVSRKVATAKVKLDGDTKAQASLDRIDFSLRRLGVTTAKPSISLQGAERAKIQLDEIEARLRLVGATTARPRVAGAGGSGGGLLGGGEGGLFGKGGFFRPGPLGLAAAFGIPAAVPLAAGAAGLGAGLLTPTVAGGLGLGLFGATAKASITNLTTVEDQIDKLNQKIAQTSPTTTRTSRAASPAQIQAAQLRLDAANAALANAQARGRSTTSAQASVLAAQSSLTALQGRGGPTTTTNKTYENLIKQRQALLKQLSPAEKDAAEGLQRLEHTWTAFQKALEPQTFTLLATGTDIFAKGLRLVEPLTKAVGDEVDTLAGRADRALSQPFWRQFFGQFLTVEAPRAVATLGTVLGNTVTGFAHLSEDFAPLGNRIEDDLIRWSGVFDKWTQGSGPERFLAVVERDGPLAAQTLKALASGMEGLAAGLEPIGRVELEALTPVLNFIGDLGKQHPEVITALGAAYLSVAVGLKGIAAVKGLAGVAGVLTGGRVGGSGGGGGVLGGLGARGASPANPLYVFVVDKAPSSSLPTTIENDVKKYGPGATLGARIGTVGRFAVGAATLIGADNPVVASLLGGGSDKGDTSGEKYVAAIQQLLAKFSIRGNDVFAPNGMRVTGPAAQAVLLGGRTNPISTDAGNFLGNFGPRGTTVPGAKDLRQELLLLDSTLNATSRNVDTLDARNTAMLQHMEAYSRNIMAEEARLKDLFAGMPGWIADAIKAAENGGFEIGKNLAAGITLGIQQGQGKVEIVTAQLVKGALHVAHNTAQLGSPSKITTQYGKWIAEGLAVGFAGYTPDLLKAFSSSTQVVLDRLGYQVNAAASQYRNDLAARTQLAGSVKSGITGAADISQITTSNTSGGSISAFLSGQVTLDKRLATDLARLRKMGLSSVLLQQIAAAGPVQGVALAERIIASGAAGVASDNRSVNAIYAAGGSIGATVSNATFAPTLAKDQAALVRDTASLVRALSHGLRLNNADMQQLARDIAREFAKVMPTINVKELDKALGLKVLSS